MPGVLSLARALPSLRSPLLHRDLTTVDDQAVAFPLALVAYGAMPQSRTTAVLAGRRQFFIHFVSLHLSGKQPGLPVIVPARDRLPKSVSGSERREAAGESLPLSSAWAVSIPRGWFFEKLRWPVLKVVIFEQTAARHVPQDLCDTPAGMTDYANSQD